MKKELSVSKIRNLACGYFVIVGLATVILGALTSGFHIWRELAVLVVLSLPMLINKRFFHLMYGLVSGMISLAMLLVYTSNNNPSQIDISLGMFLFGMVIFMFAFASSLALIYVATYSSAKNTFTLT